jgi:type IV pilus assembly protein PilF
MNSTTANLKWALLFGLGLLIGCAVPSGSSTIANDAPQPVTSDSPQADIARRASIRLELASGYLSQNKPQFAIDEANQALALDPRMTEALVVRGLAYSQNGEPAAAEQSYRRALAIDGQYGSALHNLGWLLCQQRKFPDAQSMFQRALEAPRYRDHVLTWLAKGVCEVSSGAYTEAKVSLQRAFEMEPTNPIANFNLGKLYFKLQDFNRAQFYINRINSTAQANAESLHLGILVERRLGAHERARMMYQQLRAGFPNSLQLARLDRGDDND